MKRLLAKLRRYYHVTYVCSILIVSIAILYLIMPGESRFGYEFQKNTPWQHDNLVAPFDFAIYKDDAQIKAEKDSVRINFNPYFKKDSTIAHEQCVAYRNILERTSKDSIATRLLVEKLEHIYNVGILSQSQIANPILANKNKIQVILAKSVSIELLSNIYSIKTAFSELSKQEISLLGNDISKKINSVNFIIANLTYEEEYNRQELQHLEANTSETLGMVQAGERIILKGDIVTSELFRILTSLKTAYESRKTLQVNHLAIIIGKLLVILSCLSMLALYFIYFRPQIFNEKRHLSFILLIILLMVFAYSFIIRYDTINIYAIPIVVLPMLVRIFFDSRTAIFAHIISALLIGYFAPNNFEFFFLSVIAGVTAVFSFDKLNRRADIVLSAFWVLVSYSVLYIAFSMIHEGSLQNINWYELKWFVLNAFLVLLVYPLIYIFERLFGFVSDVTLIELSSTNQPLLKKMSEEAPGTFQHVLQVANLSEAIARSIDANPYLAYTGALYHDIGKIIKPIYFTENKTAGESPHNKLSFEDSAKEIIAHVEDGIKLAKKCGLPEIIIDFIRTHHGTTQAKYFYIMAKKENPDILPNAFTYPGPRPKTKENAIVMIVDGIEAGMRSLNDKTHENMRDFIDMMISTKLKEHQLDLSPLTLKDITTIKEILLEKLLNVYHVRIAYPKENN